MCKWYLKNWHKLKNSRLTGILVTEGTSLGCDFSVSVYWFAAYVVFDCHIIELQVIETPRSLLVSCWVTRPILFLQVDMASSRPMNKLCMCCRRDMIGVGEWITHIILPLHLKFFLFRIPSQLTLKMSDIKEDVQRTLDEIARRLGGPGGVIAVIPGRRGYRRAHLRIRKFRKTGSLYSWHHLSHLFPHKAVYLCSAIRFGT